MPINDFAGPIIQAYMQGKALKRQSEQDEIAKKEREQALKLHLEQSRREEAHFKAAASKLRFDYDNALRQQMATGMRAIPTEAASLPGGLDAPQTTNPIAQQLMQAPANPSADGMPQLQSTAPTEIPTLPLGKQFAIPETNAIQNPIHVADGIGTFDLSKMPSYDEVSQRELLKHQLVFNQKLQETDATEGIKSKYQQQENKIKEAGLDKRAGATLQVRRDEVAAKKNAQQLIQDYNQQRLEIQRAQLEQARANSKQHAAIAWAKIGAKKAEGEVTSEDAQASRQSLIKSFADETNTKEDIVHLVPQKEREQFTHELRKAGVALIDKKQKEALNGFSNSAKFFKAAKQMSDSINGGVLQGLPMSDAYNLRTSLLARIEGIGRGDLDMKGVFTDKDLDRMRGILADWQPRQGRTADNERRVALLKDIIVGKFTETYHNLPSTKQLELAKRTGLLPLMEKKSK